MTKFKAAGVDLMPYVAQGGFSTSYDSVYGALGGMMQDGTETVDELRKKLTIDVTFYAATEAALANILSLFKPTYVNIEYADALHGSKSYQAHVSKIPQSVMIRYKNGTTIWQAGTISIVER